MINSSWLSFVGDQDHKADTEIFEQDFFLRLRDIEILRNAVFNLG